MYTTFKKTRQRIVLQLTQGVSMFEMIIAIFIIAIVVTSIASLSTVAIRNNTFATNKILANNFAQQGMDLIRNERDMSFAAFATKANAAGLVWCIDDTEGGLDNMGACTPGEVVKSDGTQSGEDTIFIREATLIATTPQIITANIQVMWEDGQGLHIVSMDSDFTNWSFLP